MQVYSKLIELSELHQRIMLGVAMGKRETYRMFNLLPTEAKRQMDTFHSQWETLNTNIIQSARQVGTRLCPSDKDCSNSGVLIKTQRNISCPIERIFRAVDQKGDMTMAEVCMLSLPTHKGPSLREWKKKLMKL